MAQESSRGWRSAAPSMPWARGWTLSRPGTGWWHLPSMGLDWRTSRLAARVKSQGESPSRRDRMTASRFAGSAPLAGGGPARSAASSASSTPTCSTGRPAAPVTTGSAACRSHAPAAASRGCCNTWTRAAGGSAAPAPGWPPATPAPVAAGTACATATACAHAACSASRSPPC